MFVKGGTIIFRQKKKKKKGKKSTLLLCQIPAVAGEFIPSPTRDLISYLVLYIFAFSLMTKNNNLKMWFHIETWHNAQLLKFYRNSLLLFSRAWSKFTRNPRARQLHFFYLFQLLLQLHCPLGYGTTDRVLDPLHIGVHVVQSQHLAPARDPVHCLLRHVFRYVTSTPVSADIWNIEEDGGSEEIPVAVAVLEQIRFYQPLPVCRERWCQSSSRVHFPSSFSELRLTTRALAVDIPLGRRHAFSSWLAGLFPLGFSVPTDVFACCPKNCTSGAHCVQQFGERKLYLKKKKGLRKGSFQN